MKMLVVLIGIIAATWAYADAKPVPATKVTYEKSTKLDFEDRDVDGEFQTPDGQSVSADKNLTFETMLDPKTDFKKELKRSMGAVR